MCLERNTDLSLQVVNASNILTDVRDLLVYGTNALHICHDLCANYQNTWVPNLSNHLVTKGPIGDRGMGHIHGDNYVGVRNLKDGILKVLKIH